MIITALEYNAHDWGSQAKARRARDAAAKLFEDDGYDVYKKTAKALNQDFNGYRLIVVENDDVKPALPDGDRRGDVTIT